MNQEQDINLTVTDPPLKRFKKEIEKLSNLEPQIAVLPLEMVPETLNANVNVNYDLLTENVINQVQRFICRKFRNYFNISGSFKSR